MPVDNQLPPIDNDSQVSEARARSDSLPEIKVLKPAEAKTAAVTLHVLSAPRAETPPSIRGSRCSIVKDKKNSVFLSVAPQTTAGQVTLHVPVTRPRSRSAPPPLETISSQDGLGAVSIRMQIKPKTQATLPQNAAQHLAEWVCRNQTELLKNDKRILWDQGLTPEEMQSKIGTAFAKFETEFDSQWRVMKDKCEEPWVMQVINDLRAYSLEAYVFNPVKRDFNEKNAHLLEPFSNELKNRFSGEDNGKVKSMIVVLNAGSNDVTSDNDAALDLRTCRNAMLAELEAAEDKLHLMESATPKTPTTELRKQEQLIQAMESKIEALLGMLNTRETRASDMANELSKNVTGGYSWANLFDSNFYTMQEIQRASTPEKETQRAELQQRGSLLMKAKTDPAGYAKMKDAAITQAQSPDHLFAINYQFAKVDELTEDNNLLFNKKVIEISMEKTTDPRERGRLETILKGNDFELISELATTLLKLDGDRRVQASDALHAQFKKSAASSEQLCAKLFFIDKTLVKFAKAGNVEDFAKTYNSGIEASIAQLKFLRLNKNNEKSLPEIETAIKDLESRYLDLNNLKAKRELMTAFKLKSEIETQQKTLNQARTFIEGTNKEFVKLSATLNAGGDASKMAEISSKIDLLAKETFNQLEKILKDQPDLKRQILAQSLEHAMNTLIPLFDRALAEANKEAETLAQRYGVIWEEAGILSRESDRALLNMQSANMQGMLFAQEAHVSEGAFSWVVENQQMGKRDIRTLNQLVDAFTEIDAFHNAHQEHKTTPAAKLIEASKYANRLTGNVGDINERCFALGVKPPVVESESNGTFTLENLQSFAKQMLVLRKDGKSSPAEKERMAQDITLKVFNRNLDESFVNEINGRMQEINHTLFAWVTNLPPNIQNAYYKAA